MKRVNPAISCLISILFILCALPAWAGVYYRYTDKNGTVYFTDRYEGIPPEYRGQAQTIRERSLPAAPSPLITEPAQRRGRDEQSRQAPEGSRENLAEKEAQEKAAREAEEKKLQARLQKEKQIEDLKKEIDNRVDEQKKLRTNWMAYDRATIYRLNQEIEGLQKHIQSIQEGMGK